MTETMPRLRALPDWRSDAAVAEEMARIMERRTAVAQERSVAEARLRSVRKALDRLTPDHPRHAPVAARERLTADWITWLDAEERRMALRKDAVLRAWNETW